MRPRPQLDSDLGTTKSSSGNNKQKENKNKHGSRFGVDRINLHFACFHLRLNCPGLALLKEKFRSICFEKFEEDFISVVFRIVY